MSNAATAVPETRLRGRAKNSQTREIISRFMKNKVAVAGFFIILPIKESMMQVLRSRL